MDMLAQLHCASITERVYACASKIKNIEIDRVWQAGFSNPASAEGISRRLGIVRQYAKMTSRKRNAILEEFILIYKSEPCIWRVKDKEYHDRNKRTAAYEKLLTKLRELETNATKEDVVKKINALRSNVRREKRKIDESTKSGASADEIYKPSLWYYDMFELLGDQDTPRTSQSNIVDADEIEEISDITDTNENTTLDTDVAPDNTTQNSVSQEQQQQQAEKQPRVSRPGKKNNEQDKLTNDVLNSIRDHFKRPAASPPSQEDRYDLLGKSIALKLRAMEKRQRLIAEKLINDTSFEGEMGNLSTESYQNRNIPHYHRGQYVHSPNSTSISSSSPHHTSTRSPSPSLMQQFQYSQFNSNSSQNPLLIQLPSTSLTINNFPADVQLSIPENTDSMNNSTNVQFTIAKDAVTASTYYSNFELN